MGTDAPRRCRSRGCLQLCEPGYDACPAHVEHLRAIAAKGAHASRARSSEERREQAAAVALDAIADVRRLLLVAARSAILADDRAAMIAACRVALEAIKTGDMERELAELRALIEARTGGIIHGHA